MGVGIVGEAREGEGKGRGRNIQGTWDGKTKKTSTV